MTMQIPVGKDGIFTLVDDEDFEFLSRFSWTTKRNPLRGQHRVQLSSHKIKGQTRSIHRIIMCVGDPKLVVDHIDGNTLNNCKNNLRVCTHKQNSWNRKPTKSQKYKGVVKATIRKKYKDKTYIFNCYRTNIIKDGKLVHCRAHKNEIDAAKDYNIQAIKYFGEYARLNIIKED